MRIFVIDDQNMFKIPTLTAYDVVKDSRRHFTVRRGQDILVIHKASHDVFTQATAAICDYERRLKFAISELEREIADCVDNRRAEALDILCYDLEGRSTLTSVRKGGKWLDETSWSHAI